MFLLIDDHGDRDPSKSSSAVLAEALPIIRIVHPGRMTETIGILSCGQVQTLADRMTGPPSDCPNVIA